MAYVQYAKSINTMSRQNIDILINQIPGDIKGSLIVAFSGAFTILK